MKRRLAALLCAALSLGAMTAFGQPAAEKTLRLSGEAASAEDPAPKAFVIDARVKPGDSEFQTSVEGWFAASAAPPVSGELTGSCVEHHCVLTADLDDAKFILTGDFGDAAGPAAARFVVKDSGDKVLQQGAASLARLTGPVAGQGDLAAPDAVGAAELDDLLLWNQQSVSSGSPPSDEPPSDSQREALATWQGQKGRLATGLIFAADLQELRADAAAARRAAGWTPLGDPAHGWSAGYPAALLPNASRNGVEQRFASADGKAVLVVAIDPPMSSEDFDAFVEKVSADRDGRSHVDTVRVNGELEMSYEEAGQVTAAMYRDREGGFARLVFTYPAADRERYERFEPLLQHGLTASDDLKP